MEHPLVNVPAMLWIVILYLVLLLVVGWYFYNKSKGQEGKDDFFLAGRGLGKVVAIGTILATYTGSGTVTGGANSLAYNFGLWPGFCFTLPAVFGMLVLLLLSKKIRESNCTTVAEMIEKKYGFTARIFSAVIIALSMISIVSYQYRGLGFILNATTGLTVDASTIICCAVVVLLAFSGGLKTVATTDAMSAFLMVFGLAVSLPVLLKTVGGVDWIVSTAQATDPNLLTFSGGQTLFGWLGGYLPLFFLTIGDQNHFQRIVAAKDLKTARTGLFGCLVACIIIMPVVATFAFIGRLYFGANIQAGQALISTATLMPLIWGGIVLAAASAFTVTTGDSYLLSGASNFTIDIYKTKINPNATPKQEMRATRLFILIAGVLAYVILQFFPSVLAVQYWSYTIYGAGITPAVFCALVWPKVTKAGGIASMLIGTALTIVWEALGMPFGIQTVIIALPVSAIVIVVVSLLTQPKQAAQA